MPAPTPRELTDAYLRGQQKKPPPATLELADKNSPLKATVRPDGTITFYLWRRWGGAANPAIRTIGRYGEIRLADARELAQQWTVLGKAGGDPLAERRKAEEAEAEARALTFEAVWEEYKTLKLSKLGRGTKTGNEVERAVLDAWRNKPLKDILKRDIVAAIDKITARGHNYAAFNAYAGISAFFSWADRRGVYGLEVNPFSRLSKRDVVGPTPHRERNLSDDELRCLWKASGREGYPFGDVIKLLMLTGARLTEIGEASWSEFDPRLIQLIRKAHKDDVAIDWTAVPDEFKRLTIPRGRFKSDASHIIALSDKACEVVASLPHFAGPFVFTTTEGRRPVSGFSVAKKRIDRDVLRYLQATARARGQDREKVTLERWTHHDLRHVMRTRLAAMRVPFEVCEMIVGHAKSGLQRVYDQHSYEPEMREALQRWADRLGTITKPSHAIDNVVPFYRARG